MRVFHLEKNETIYSCNSYLILGDWNRVEDVNTIIDPGTDDFILNQIEALATGLGKVPVEQVILTHNHFDHNGGVRALKNRYGARVLAYADGADVDELLVDGHFLKAGDDFLEVIHTPGHSSDSICLYAPSIRTLFSGDTQVRIRSAGDVYTQEYLDGLIEICNRNITTIYSGHDDVMTEQVKEMLQTSVANVRKCTVVASLGESAK